MSERNCSLSHSRQTVRQFSARSQREKHSKVAWEQSPHNALRGIQSRSAINLIKTQLNRLAIFDVKLNTHRQSGHFRRRRSFRRCQWIYGSCIFCVHARNWLYVRGVLVYVCQAPYIDCLWIGLFHCSPPHVVCCFFFQILFVYSRAVESYTRLRALPTQNVIQ